MSGSTCPGASAWSVGEMHSTRRSRASTPGPGGKPDLAHARADPCSRSSPSWRRHDAKEPRKLSAGRGVTAALGISSGRSRERAEPAGKVRGDPGESCRDRTIRAPLSRCAPSSRGACRSFLDVDVANPAPASRQQSHAFRFSIRRTSPVLARVARSGSREDPHGRAGSRVPRLSAWRRRSTRSSSEVDPAPVALRRGGDPPRGSPSARTRQMVARAAQKSLL